MKGIRRLVRISARRGEEEARTRRELSAISHQLSASSLMRMACPTESGGLKAESD